jgi:hypothetical protein
MIPRSKLLEIRARDFPLQPRKGCGMRIRILAYAPVLGAQLVVATAALPADEALAAGVADQCFAFVQGNIPWNYAGATGWNPANVRRLCGATTRAGEPGRCFDRVMTGNINWGGGVQWQWQNALDLCASTSDANATIDCFTARMGSGLAWPQAIAACKYAVAAVPPAPPVGGPCYNFVQGNIPWNYGGATSWNPANVNNLCAGTSNPAEPGRCFDRVMNGGVNWGGGTNWQWQNALKLCKGTNSAANTIACFQSQIAGGVPWQNAIEACNG